MSTHHPYEEKELLLHIAEGDELAMKTLFTAHYRSLVFFAGRILQSKEDAEDVVAQVFSRLWVGRRQLQAVNHLNAFLYTSVKNACLDWIRQQKKLQQQAVPGNFWMDKTDDTEVNLEAIKADVVKIIHQQIDELPDKCRQVFLLSYIEGLSARQVADTLGISVSNVTSQRSRAIQLLRKSILDKELWALLVLVFRQF